MPGRVGGREDINHAFLIFCTSDALTAGALLGSGETAPPPCSQFLELVNNLLVSTCFKCKPTPPEQVTPPHRTSCARLSHSRQRPAFPNHPQPGTSRLGTAPVPQSLQGLLRLAHPEPAHPALPVLCLGNHNKDSCPCFPLTPFASCLMLVLPHMALQSVTCPSFSEP